MGQWDKTLALPRGSQSVTRQTVRPLEDRTGSYYYYHILYVPNVYVLTYDRTMSQHTTGLL